MGGQKGAEGRSLITLLCCAKLVSSNPSIDFD